MLHSGIDLHKKDLVIDTLDASGTAVSHRRLRAERPLVARYFRSLPGPHRAVVEATASWYWLADLLKEEGIELTLAHSKLAGAIAYAKVKTDAVDAHTLAQLLRVDLIPRAHMISAELRGIRDVLRVRLRLVQKRSRCLNAITSLLTKYNVPSVGDLPALALLEAECHQQQIALLTRQIKRVIKTISPELLATDPVQHLLWIPGIGRINAFSIYLEIDDITRFPSAKHWRCTLRVHRTTPLLRPTGAGLKQLGWEDQAQAQQGRQSLPQDRLHACRGACDPVLPRDQGVLPAAVS